MISQLLHHYSPPTSEIDGSSVWISCSSSQTVLDSCGFKTWQNDCCFKWCNATRHPTAQLGAGMGGVEGKSRSTESTSQPLIWETTAVSSTLSSHYVPWTQFDPTVKKKPSQLIFQNCLTDLSKHFSKFGTVKDEWFLHRAAKEDVTIIPRVINILQTKQNNESYLPKINERSFDIYWSKFFAFSWECFEAPPQSLQGKSNSCTFLCLKRQVFVVKFTVIVDTKNIDKISEPHTCAFFSLWSAALYLSQSSIPLRRKAFTTKLSPETRTRRSAGINIKLQIYESLSSLNTHYAQLFSPSGFSLRLHASESRETKWTHD